MRPLVNVAAAVLTLVLWLAPAHAEDLVTYEVDGEADAAATDARVAALDDAFGRAVTTALADLVTGNVRTSKKQDLDREIVGHARLWIAKFTVTKDQTSDDRRQLTVTVRVDREKMRTRLVELGIQDTPAPVGDAPSAKARGVAILLRVADPTATHASYGVSAEKDVAGTATIAGALKAAGYAVKRATAAGPTARAAGDLPLDDDEAETLADEAKAELAIIAGVTVGPATPVRGVATQAALVTAHVKLIDAKGHKVVGQGTAMLAAPSDDPAIVALTVERVLRGALGDVLPAPARAIAQAPGFHGDDTPIADPGVVLVRIPPKTPWNLVLAEQKFLLGTKGVQAAAIRRLSPAGWILGITTAEPIERIASTARRSPAKDITTTVKIVGSIIEVRLSGTP